MTAIILLALLCAVGAEVQDLNSVAAAEETECLIVLTAETDRIGRVVGDQTDQ